MTAYVNHIVKISHCLPVAAARRMIEDGDSKEEETETVSSSFATFLWQAFLSVVRKKCLKDI